MAQPPITLSIVPQANVTEEEVAAALAAVRCVLEADPPQTAASEARPQWRTAALLEAQGYATVGGGNYATWNGTDRAKRARRWSKGIIGS